MTDEVQDYSFMAVDIGAARDLQVLDEGTEARVGITKATAYPKNCSILCRVKVLDRELVRSFSHWVYYPKPDDDSDKANNKLLMLKAFHGAFDIPNGVADPEEFIGHEANVLLRIEESTDARYPTANAIQRFVTPGA